VKTAVRYFYGALAGGDDLKEKTAGRKRETILGRPPSGAFISFNPF
jgi:hypothetical protein